MVTSDTAAILIDGGESRAFNSHIATELAAGPPLDVVLVTHWDRDHILGIRDLYLREDLAAVRAPIVHFNHFIRTAEPRFGPSSVQDGSNLVALLRSRDVAIRDASAGESLTFDDLMLSVLGPSQDLLEKAENEWNEHISALGQADTGFMAAMAAVDEDDSPTNRASITTLVSEPDGPPLALLTGDATGSDLLDQLVGAGLMPEGGSIHVPVIKVQHHGSERNVSAEFVKRVTADHYILSANGHHDNPDESALELLIAAAADTDAAIWFTSEGNSENQRKRMKRKRRQVETASVRIGNPPNTPVEIELR